jgi:phage-related protein
MAWTIEPPDERVKAEIRGLPEDMQARYIRIANLLTEFGPQRVGMPYVRPLGNKLWEMRLKGKAGIGRILYVALPGQRLMLLHAFIKKTQETPRRALELAMARLEEHGR